MFEENKNTVLNYYNSIIKIIGNSKQKKLYEDIVHRIESVCQLQTLNYKDFANDKHIISPRFVMKECYANCARVIMNNPHMKEMKYVEGVVIFENMPAIPIEHAWLEYTSSNNKTYILDPTYEYVWRKESSSNSYFKISEFSYTELIEYLKEDLTFGPFMFKSIIKCNR